MFRLAKARSYFSNKKLLEQFGIKNPNILRNLTYIFPYEGSLSIMNGGFPYHLQTQTQKNLFSLAVEPSAPTLASEQGIPNTIFSRSPKDKRIVMDPIREKEIWWGDVNKPLEP